MKVTIGSEVVIDKPVDEVFQFVAVRHRENHSRWDVQVSRLEPETPGPMALGSRFRIVRRNFGREESRTFEITDWQPPRRMTMTTSAPAFDLSLRGDFLAVEGGRTKHVLTGEASIGGVRGLLAPLMKRKFQHDIEQNLGRIKTLVEAGS
jgi:polyketide cyclase/dehydrase/lipid transport protein